MENLGRTEYVNHVPREPCTIAVMKNTWIKYGKRFQDGVIILPEYSIVIHTVVPVSFPCSRKWTCAGDPSRAEFLSQPWPVATIIPSCLLLWVRCTRAGEATLCLVFHISHKAINCIWGSSVISFFCLGLPLFLPRSSHGDIASVTVYHGITVEIDHYRNFLLPPIAVPCYFRGKTQNWIREVSCISRENSRSFAKIRLLAYRTIIMEPVHCTVNTQNHAVSTIQASMNAPQNV